MVETEGQQTDLNNEGKNQNSSFLEMLCTNMKDILTKLINHLPENLLLILTKLSFFEVKCI